MFSGVLPVNLRYGLPSMQGTSVSHVGKRKVIDSKVPLGENILVPTTVTPCSYFLMEYSKDHPM